MVRVFKEQCVVEHDAVTGNKRIIIKTNKEIASDSLQNPSDPDAGYDGHKGKGYQVQVGETYDTSEDKNTSQLSLITYVEVEPANASDANALLPYLEATREKDIAPEEILADSLYGSDSNYEQAGKEGVELVAPTMGKPRDTTCSLSDCEFSDDGVITACPQGHKPVKAKQKKGKCNASFPLAMCSNCPVFAHCPAKTGKNDQCYNRYGQKAVRLARRRSYERTEAFKERYRFRTEVEATMSQLDRRTGLKHLRVRGLKAVRFAATLKATAINILRAAACRKRRKRDKDHGMAPFTATIELFRIVKERFFARFGNSICSQGQILDRLSFSTSI